MTFRVRFSAQLTPSASSCRSRFVPSGEGVVSSSANCERMGAEVHDNG